jgi:hypothetical protein
MSSARYLVDLDGAPWNDVAENARKGGSHAESWEVKVLTAPDGCRTQLSRVTGWAVPHIHTKASSGFVFAGEMELRGHVCAAGTWFLEPYGAIHPQTTFRKVTYGFGMREGVYGNNGNIVLADIDNLPPWIADIGAKPDTLQNAVVAASLPWRPFGDGLEWKVLHAFDRSAWFASMLKADAGARLPRRRYVGPTDFYVMSGRMEFGEAVAERGWWVHEPAGSDEDAVVFPVETILLVNTYGTVLEYDGAGSVTRILDGYSLQREEASV